MSGNRIAADSAVTALAPLVWGSTYLVTTEFLPPDRPLLAATVRALPAGLILLAIGRQLPRGDWWWRAATLGTLNIGAFLYLLFVAAYHLPGGVAALVMAVQPTIVLALSSLLLKERITAASAVACGLGLAGVGLLALTPGAGVDAAGIGAGLLGAVCMAAGIVLTKRWGRPPEIGLLTFTGWQLSAGGIVLLPAMLIGEGLPGSVDGRNVAGFAYLGLVGALLAYAVWFRGVERLPAFTVSVLGFGSPLAAMTLGYVVLGESLSPAQLGGALLVLTAVCFALPRKPKGRKPVPQPPPPHPSTLSRASRPAPR
ncbi:EamA family transporter [Streptomyces sp. NPDC059166]|uniref:EamA family transporter n=1 Tax=Streptomyces sp. NPDC059166 TaxID=3346752 RepID=UPI003674622D